MTHCPPSTESVLAQCQPRFYDMTTGDIPSSLLFSSVSAFVGCLTSTASSITRFINSSKPCIWPALMRTLQKGLLGSAYSDLSLYSYCQLFIEPNGDSRPLLKEFENKVDWW